MTTTTLEPSAVVSERMTLPLRSRLGQWHYVLAYLTVGLAVVAALVFPAFVSPNNFSQLVAGVSEKALLILPMALIIIVREIDLSVASIMGLSSVSLGVLLQGGVPLVPAIMAALLVGTLAGAFNGYFVAHLGLPAIVVTLGSLALFRGLCYVVLGSESISAFPATLTDFGFGYIRGTRIPLTILPFVVLVVLYAILLHRTATGRRILALGGNPDAALYSGVRTRRLTFWLFTTAGMVAGLAGIIYTARLSSARADNAFGLELDVITIVFLGGVSMLGGRGNIAGIAWALALIAIVRNVLGLNGVAGDAQGTIVGLILVFSLLLTNTVGSALQRRRQKTPLERSVGDTVSTSRRKEK